MDRAPRNQKGNGLRMYGPGYRGGLDAFNCYMIITKLKLRYQVIRLITIDHNYNSAIILFVFNPVRLQFIPPNIKLTAQDRQN